jgi:hypothetical protein
LSVLEAALDAIVEIRAHSTSDPQYGEIEADEKGRGDAEAREQLRIVDDDRI